MQPAHQPGRSELLDGPSRAMQAITQAFIVVSGVPGTGKSTYANWLCQTYGFMHQDVDWQGLPSASVLAQRPLVVDWGFPANEPALTDCIALIRSWKANSARLWWFDGDREAALESFLKRGTVPKQFWDYQMAGIDDNWRKIEAVINGRLDVISPAQRLTPEQIFSHMCNSPQTL